MFTFKGYSDEELKASNGCKFIAIIKGETYIGKVLVVCGKVILISDCEELNGGDFPLEKEATLKPMYNWTIYADNFNYNSFNKEEIFELFAITKKVSEKDSWKLEVRQLNDKNVDISTTTGQMLCSICEDGIYLYVNADPSAMIMENYEKVERMFDENGRLNIHVTPTISSSMTEDKFVEK